MHINTKGIISFTTFSKGISAILEAAKRQIPTGGVSMPIKKAITKVIPI